MGAVHETNARETATETNTVETEDSNRLTRDEIKALLVVFCGPAVLQIVLDKWFSFPLNYAQSWCVFYISWLVLGSVADHFTREKK